MIMAAIFLLAVVIFIAGLILTGAIVGALAGFLEVTCYFILLVIFLMMIFKVFR